MADQDESDEVAAQLGSAGASEGKPNKRVEGEGITQHLRRLRWVVPVIWLVAVIAAGQISGIHLAFLVTAGGVLVLVITLLWISVQSLTGGAALGFEEALGMGAPSKVEEEKRAVLRALKDLEYERGVGKITPEDYAELSARYRAHAKRLMQTVDEALAPARDEVERALEKRLAREGLLGEPKASEPAPDPGEDARVGPKANEPEPSEPEANAEPPVGPQAEKKAEAET